MRAPSYLRRIAMTERTLRSVALVAFVLTAIAIASRIARPVESDSYERDCKPRSVHYHTNADAYVLRVAVVVLGAADEAILDYNELVLKAGETFQAKFSFATLPSKVPGRHPPAATSWFARPELNDDVRRRRKLPPEYGGFELRLDLKGRYFGAHDGVHLLTFEKLEGHSRHYDLRATRGGPNGMHLHATALHENEAIARISTRENLAFLAVLTKQNSSCVRDPGQRIEWREAFRASRSSPPVFDRRAVTRAVEVLRPSISDELPSDAFLGFGPLVELTTSAFILRDIDSLRFAERRFSADPGLLEIAFRAGLPSTDAAPSAHFSRHGGRAWKSFVKAWMSGNIAEWPSHEARRHWAPLMRLLAVTNNEAVADSLTEKLSTRCSQFLPRRFVMEREDFGSTAVGRSAYRHVRRQVVRSLPLPWNLVLGSNAAMLAYALLVPLLALFASCARSRRHDQSTTVSPSLVFILGIGSFVTLGELPLRFLIVPFWWILGVRYLRDVPGPSTWDRCLVFVTLTLSTLDMLCAVGWFFTHPALEAGLDSALMFAWILVGALVLLDGRWRGGSFFAAFLWIWLLAIGLATFDLLDPTVGSLLTITFFACLAFFWLLPPEPSTASRGQILESTSQRS